MTTSKTVTSICRNCGAFCPILVTVENGRPIKVTGDPEAKEYEGYTCPKGRALPDQHNDPGRLLHSLRRKNDGTFETIASQQAVVEVADKIKAIVDKYGPRSIAVYHGGGVVSQYFGQVMAHSMLNALRSPMMFAANTIDKPCEPISLALHGVWQPGAHSFSSSDTYILVGANPVIAKSNGAPYNNPGMRLKEAVNNGMKLIVIDPRHTETARRAHVHLQALPGEDAAILAGIINIIITEDMCDEAFIAENAVGFEVLKNAVARFTPHYVAARAGISVEQFLEAARTFGRGKRGAVVCATGPSFSVHGNLVFYLGLCLNTICGRWARAGELVPSPNVLMPPAVHRAQPFAPWPVFGTVEMKATGLKQNASGLPTAALADEILFEGEERVHALICMGGNPMSAWPDERRTEAALRNLDLLVQIDVTMSATARLAHYVVATPMILEVPATTYLPETLKYLGVSRGSELAWGQYTDAVCDFPSGSDLIPEHAFFFRIAQRLGLQLEWTRRFGIWKCEENPPRTFKFDMSRVPTFEELCVIQTAGSRIPLDEIKRHPHGRVYPDDTPIQPRDPSCTDMLQIADPMMMAELDEVYAEDYEAKRSDKAFPYRLLCRRANDTMNSILVNVSTAARKKPYNPAFMHPDDLKALGVKDGDIVTVRSKAGAILGIAERDSTLRRGMVSMTHGYGGHGRAHEKDPRFGSNINLLVSLDERDPISGIPRMSTIPVSIEKYEQAGSA